MKKAKLLVFSAIISSFLIFIYIGGAQLCVAALRTSIEIGEAYPLIRILKIILALFGDLLPIILVLSLCIWFVMVILYKKTSRNEPSGLTEKLNAEQGSGQQPATSSESKAE